MPSWFIDKYGSLQQGDLFHAKYLGLGRGSDVVRILDSGGGGVWVDDDDAVLVGVFHDRLPRHE